jgi:hypothetical protein
MSQELAKQLFDGLRGAARDGLQQVTAEAGRLGTQGTMELASALFSGHAFVPYGPGQYTPTPDRLQQPQPDQKQKLDHSRDR